MFRAPFSLRRSRARVAVRTPSMIDRTVDEGLQVEPSKGKTYLDVSRYDADLQQRLRSENWEGPIDIKN